MTYLTLLLLAVREQNWSMNVFFIYTICVFFLTVPWMKWIYRLTKQEVVAHKSKTSRPAGFPMSPRVRRVLRSVSEILRVRVSIREADTEESRSHTWRHAGWMIDRERNKQQLEWPHYLLQVCSICAHLLQQNTNTAGHVPSHDAPPYLSTSCGWWSGRGILDWITWVLEATSHI